jgi:hypothetical protein
MFGAARVGILIVFGVATAASLLLLALMLLALRPTPTHVAKAEPVTVAAESERVTKVAQPIAQPIEPVMAVGEPAAPVRAVEPVAPVRAIEPVTPVRTAGDDFCARYGLHKVVTRGGRSWRCQRV